MKRMRLEQMAERTSGRGLSRRRFLAAAGKGTLAATLGGPLLAACGSDGATTTSTSPTPTNGTGSTPPSVGETITLRYATGTEAENPAAQAISVFKEYVEEASDGQINVDVFVGGAIGDSAALIEQLRAGAIQLHHTTPAWLSALVPSLALLDLPYLFTSKEQAFQVAEGRAGQALGDLLRDDAGLRIMGWVDFGARHMFNTVRPIHTVEDTRGITLRSQGAPVHLDLWSTLGFNPVTMDFTEVYSAIQSGVVDGLEAPIPSVLGTSLDEVVDYCSLTSHLFALGPVLTNEEFWQQLSPDHQRIIEEGHEREIAWAREAAREAQANEEEELADRGVEINSLSDEAIEEFARIAREVHERHIEEIGHDLMGLALEDMGA